MKIRRAARRLCRSEMDLVCMLRQKRRHAGVAQTCTRPENRRMVSASDRQVSAFFERPDTGIRKRRVPSSGTGLALC